jgi:hypothetical protein
VPSECSRVVSRILREALAAGLPGLLAASLFFALPGLSRSQGETRREEPGSATLCGEWHRGGGETRELDRRAVERSYEALKKGVARALDRNRETGAPDLDRPFGGDLPSCRGDEERTVTLPEAARARLRGKRFFFLAVDDPSRVRLPAEVAQDRSTEILLVGIRRLREVPDVARVLGRPVSLVGAGFARALGVRCAPSLVTISEKGDAIHLHESR